MIRHVFSTPTSVVKGDIPFHAWHLITNLTSKLKSNIWWHGQHLISFPTINVKVNIWSALRQLMSSLMANLRTNSKSEDLQNRWPAPKQITWTVTIGSPLLGIDPVYMQFWVSKNRRSLGWFQWVVRHVRDPQWHQQIEWTILDRICSSFSLMT